MKSLFKNNLYTFLLIAAIGLVTLLPFTNRETSYTMPGEYRWTLPTVVSTVLSANIAVPKLWGRPRFKKPPVAYWAMSLPAKIFGLKLFWTRLPIVIFSLFTLILFFLFLRNLNIDRKNALTGVIILLSISGYYIYSRISALEIPMLFFSLGVFYGLSELLIKEKPAGIYILLFFSAMTLLTKSHATVVSAIFFTAAWIFIYKKPGIITKNKSKWIKAVLILIGIVLPWYIYLYFSYGSEFINSMTNELVGDRFSSGKYNLTGMLIGLLTLALPYTLIFIAALIKAFKERSKDRTEENMFLILFIGSVIFPYIFVNSHRMRYMVPALPAVAALIILNFYGDKKFFRFVFKATGILTGIASGILLIVIFKMKIINIPLLLIGFLISAATVLFLLKRKLHYTAVTILAFNLFFLGFIYSGMGLWKVPDNIIKKLKDSDFSTLNRRPFFLPVRAGRVSYNDVTGVKSFKTAVEAGSLIYFPRHRMKKFKKLMDASGYNDYEKYIVWERFNEVPKKPDIIKAFKTGDINFLKEKTYFIKVK